MLRVDDDGPGIAESVRSRLFKPFVTTQKLGTGFGLAICTKIVEEHGGTIAISTSPLRGTRFEIRLPRTP
ncbi:MAG: HAMP domain-containing sensor histidine kinase [Planctomycetota bacterium]|nr:HAMP domain-containing sensor histidine kinase [Planctomycetota bacterium]